MGTELFQQFLPEKQHLVDQCTWAANGATGVVMGTTSFVCWFLGCFLGFFCPTVTNRQNKKKGI